VNALELPVRREATEPPEARGLHRDDVAMLVATRHDLEVVQARFHELPQFLSAGDLLVVNTSATLPAALDARVSEQTLQLWLSTPTPDGNWLVELRTSDRRHYPRPPLGARVELPGGVQAELLARFAGTGRFSVARFELEEPVEDYLRRHGRPIRYSYVPKLWPLERTKLSLPSSPGAPRCRAPAGPSRRSS
jgi:S-adenosylmethionine:tRNA ribosyltransferase-isomerase